MQPFSAKCHSKVRLDGKTVIVTGCNTGIGKECVLDFYKRGAKVIMACRDITKAESAKNDIEKRTSKLQNLGQLVVRKLDLSSLKSVREFASRVNTEEEQVNILLNNAGILVSPQGKTEDGFDTQFSVNHLGHFLLTLLLLPKIINSGPARIVNVSSLAHNKGASDLEDPNFEKRPYSAWGSYCENKLANILFTKELSRKLEENGITSVNCYSLHPGAIATDLPRNFDSIFFRGMSTIYNITAGCFFKTPEQGAQTSIFCSLDEKCANETGLYYTECAVKKPNDAAENKESARKLWDLSIKAVKLEENPFVPKI